MGCRHPVACRQRLARWRRSSTAPVDSLRIVANHDPLIFAPGEQFTFDLRTAARGRRAEHDDRHRHDAHAGARPHARCGARSSGCRCRSMDPAVATLHVPMPRQEGVYEIRLAVTRPPGFRERFFPGGAARRSSSGRFKSSCSTRSPRRRRPTAEWRTRAGNRPGQPDLVATACPTGRRFAGCPASRGGRWAASARSTVTHPLGEFVELPPTPPDGEPHWQAYPLPLESIGVPHLLEIEYPNDREQHLGVSIVEPDAAGRVRADRPRLGRVRRRARLGGARREAEAPARVLAADQFAARCW